MSKEIELLTEIRDLLLVVAEPALAKRDERLRESLKGIVGNSAKKADAVLLMDDSRTQAAIVKEAKIDAGALSRLVKALREASLIAEDDNPKLQITIPPEFFGEVGKKK